MRVLFAANTESQKKGKNFLIPFCGKKEYFQNSTSIISIKPINRFFFLNNPLIIGLIVQPIIKQILVDL